MPFRWFADAHRLSDRGDEVAWVQGKRVKSPHRYLSERAKTDRVDAHVLAAFPSFGRPRLNPVYIPKSNPHAQQRLTKQSYRSQDEIAAAFPIQFGRCFKSRFTAITPCDELNGLAWGITGN